MPGIKRDFYYVCPECWSVRVKLRTFKSPRYRCEGCEHEFFNLKRISHADRVLFQDVMKLTRMELASPQGIGHPPGVGAEQIKDFMDETLLRKVTVKAMKEFFKQCEK